MSASDALGRADDLIGRLCLAQGLDEIGPLARQLSRACENGAEPEADTSDLLVDMAEAMKLAEQPIDYPIKPIAARGFLTVLAGRHSAFKSWLMILTGYAAHWGGGDLAGLRCQHSTVLYVDAENGPRLLGRRFRDAGIPADGFLVADGMKLRLPKQLDQLRDLIEATDADLVVLDSLRRLAPTIRENESDDMADLIAALGGIARDLDVAIVLIHHRSSKKGAAEMRGSSSIEDQADLAFLLDAVTDNRADLRRQLRVVKFRIDAQPPPIWLQMGMVDGRFTIRPTEPCEGDGPGRPRERDAHRDEVRQQLDDAPQSGRSIAVALDLPEATVRRLLHDLEADGLAEQRPDGWVRQNSVPIGRGDSDAPPLDEEEASGDG